MKTKIALVFIVPVILILYTSCMHYAPSANNNRWIFETYTGIGIVKDTEVITKKVIIE